MQIFRHIEFLLPTHNCVIIPGFGGFVVNCEPAYYNAIGELVPPLSSLIFNQALRHNDGLLINSICDVEGISYEQANAKIREFVKQIRVKLSNNETMQCGNIGSLQLADNDNISFRSSNAMKYPQLYGLTKVQLQPINAIETLDENKKKHSLKYLVGGVAAAAIAALLYFSPLGVNLLNVNIQQAAFVELQDYTTVLSLKSHQFSSIDSLMQNDSTLIVDSMQNDSLSDSVGSIISEDQVLQLPRRTYYIVVGGDESKSQAYRSLERIRKTAFSKAEIVESPERYRIYVASFSDKKEAERYLDIFRLENSEYASAWLYSKRNV